MSRFDRKTVRRFAFVALVNLLVTALLLAALETAIRLAIPEIQELGTDRNLVIDPFYENSAALRPLATGTSDGVRFSVDKYGFWKYAQGADTTKPGWLLLGDSVTMGLGVDPDSTFAGRLAAASTTQSILNYSWIGFSSADYVNVTKGLLGAEKKTGTPFKIRHVTVFWCLNDVYAGFDMGGDPGQGVRDFAGGFLPFVKSHLRTYQWLKALLFDRPSTYFNNDVRYYERGSKFLDAAVRDLAALDSLCREQGIRFDVVMLPYEFQLRSGYVPASSPQTVLKGRLDSLDIRSYDASASFAAAAPLSTRLYRYGDGIHLSSEGHRAMFFFLAENLMK